MVAVVAEVSIVVVKTKDEAGTPGNVAGVKLKIRKEQFLKK